MIDVDNVSKISSISDSTGFVYSGLGPDARVVVRDARKKSQAYKRTYGEEKTGEWRGWVWGDGEGEGKEGGRMFYLMMEIYPIRHLLMICVLHYGDRK